MCDRILHGFFASIPLEVEEAASLEGASRWQLLRRVMLPLTLPGLVTATILASVIAVEPVVILFAVIEKHLVGGLTAGSVK